MIDVTLSNPNGKSVYLDPLKYPMHEFHISVGSRRDTTDKTQDHGQWPAYDYLGVLRFDISGDCLGTSYTDLMNLRRSLKSVFFPSPEAGNRYTVQLTGTFVGIDETVTAFCNIDGMPDMPIEAAFPSICPFSLGLESVDPVLYGTTRHHQRTGGPGTSGGLSFPIKFPFSFGTVQIGGAVNPTVAGDAPTYPIVTFYGPCTNPHITATINGVNYTYGLNDFVIDDGDYVVCDFKNRTVINSAGGNVFSALDQLSQRFYLYPGANALRFTANATGQHTDCDVAWYQAYTP